MMMMMMSRKRTTSSSSSKIKTLNNAKKNTKDDATHADKNAKRTTTKTTKTTMTLGVAALAACAAMHCNDASFADPSGGFLSGGSDHPNTTNAMMTMMSHDVSEAISQTSMAGEDIPFWANMAKYARFSISIMVGFAYMFARPVAKLLKEPKTAALVVLAGYGGFEFIKFTITEMLAMNDPESLL